MPRIQKCKTCGGSLIRVSWSSLRNHIECKQKSYLIRTGHRPPTQDSRGYLPGTITDRVVRDWLMNDPHNNPGVMPDMVADKLSSEIEDMKDPEKSKRRKEYVKWKNASDKQSVIDDCVKAVTIIEDSLNKYVLPFEFIADYQFETTVAVKNTATDEDIPVMLNGFMDILVKDRAGDYAVWDVKHTKNNDYWRKTAGQLSFYDLAIWSMFDQKTRIAGLLQPLCDKPVKVLPVSDEKRIKILHDIEIFANDILNDNATPTSDKNMCFFCDLKHACVKFKKNENGRVSFFGK